MKRALLGILGFLAALAAVTAMSFVRYLETPLGSSTDFSIERGAALRRVLSDLSQKGHLVRPDWLYVYARVDARTAIRTGTYRLRPSDSPKDLLAMVHEGRVLTESFTLVEGLNRWQTRDLLVSEQWVDGRAFDALCDDASFLAKHQIPGPSCEGYVFPETYTLARGVSTETVIATAFSQYRREFTEAIRAGRGPLDLQDRDFATLASIVEKETGAAEERARIACVFYNRLQAEPPWKLQTDPTVIYAATLEDPDFDGNIRRSHLRKMNNPYNTYLRHGLPPGPIASAGRGALRAVARPAVCGDYFFVSMNNGRHAFCPTLDCHNRAVKEWQIDFFRRR